MLKTKAVTFISFDMQIKLYRLGLSHEAMPFIVGQHHGQHVSPIQQNMCFTQQYKQSPVPLQSPLAYLYNHSWLVLCPINIFKADTTTFLQMKTKTVKLILIRCRIYLPFLQIFVFQS